MSDKTTRRMISMYEQSGNVPVVPFFTGMFQAPPENYHNSKEVEFDIERTDEDVAVVVQSLAAGARNNDATLYTNKSFIPPIYKERSAIEAVDMINRQAGQNPFEDVNFQANAVRQAFKRMRLMEKKIRRAMELQAAQVLTTGVNTLVDSAGTALYTLDFKPKATHFPTTGTAWGTVGADPLGDLLALGEVIRNDGLQDVDQVIMGTSAFEAFIKTTAVQTRFETRRADLGRISPMESMGNGGNFRGIVEVGNYQLEIWTYNARYNSAAGTKTLYLPTDKVIMRASGGRLDATFGGIPTIVPPESRVLPFLPPRVSGDRMDLHQTAFVSDDGESLMVQVGARPLMIPTAIDTFGCLDVTP